ncbi:hypothetical protein DFJ74DRAFT_459238 [Hyaloraphidium curvatum]|nr:hypothetical protein DFJ74DRAFT_459238 [Hyaloraphidium curvatum]
MEGHPGSPNGRVSSPPYPNPDPAASAGPAGVIDAARRAVFSLPPFAPDDAFSHASLAEIHPLLRRPRRTPGFSRCALPTMAVADVFNEGVDQQKKRKEECRERANEAKRQRTVDERPAKLAVAVEAMVPLVDERLEQREKHKELLHELRERLRSSTTHGERADALRSFIAAWDEHRGLIPVSDASLDPFCQPAMLYPLIRQLIDPVHAADWFDKLPVLVGRLREDHAHPFLSRASPAEFEAPAGGTWSGSSFSLPVALTEQTPDIEDVNAIWSFSFTDDTDSVQLDQGKPRIMLYVRAKDQDIGEAELDYKFYASRFLGDAGFGVSSLASIAEAGALGAKTYSRRYAGVVIQNAVTPVDRYTKDIDGNVAVRFVNETRAAAERAAQMEMDAFGDEEDGVSDDEQTTEEALLQSWDAVDSYAQNHGWRARPLIVLELPPEAATDPAFFLRHPFYGFLERNLISLQRFDSHNSALGGFLNP